MPITREEWESMSPGKTIIEDVSGKKWNVVAADEHNTLIFTLKRKGDTPMKFIWDDSTGQITEYEEWVADVELNDAGTNIQE